tara:strand:+ start:746 stop:1231 length:486 start_codon:yes stop_codon:yes gene_type:complete
MRYTILILFCVCFPLQLHTQPLDLRYSLPVEWDYCEKHKIDCERIGNFDNSILPQFDMQEPITTVQWATFVSLQLADIYSTYKGLQYDCVKELNPVLGESPSVTKMFVTKTIVLTPAIRHDLGKGNLTPKTMDEINFLMSIVVANNLDVYNRSKKRCKKIR